MKANINDAVIRYEDSGNGPAILVLHDGPSNRDICKPFQAVADSGYRVIVTNLDGLEKKRRLAKGDLSACSRSAVALLNFLGVGRAVVFGIDAGALVLLDLLKLCPDRIAASSLVFAPSMAAHIRKMAARPEIGAALKAQRFGDIKEELLSTLPFAGKEKGGLSSLPQLKRWIEQVQSRNLYLSAIHHRSTLLADMDVPPLILEDEEKAGDKGAKKKGAFRGWRTIKGFNAHFSALIHLLTPPDEDHDEEEVFSGPR